MDGINIVNKRKSDFDIDRMYYYKENEQLT